MKLIRYPTYRRQVEGVSHCFWSCPVAARGSNGTVTTSSEAHGRRNPAREPTRRGAPAGEGEHPAPARQAVIIIHGMGEQVPLETIGDFVDTLYKRDPAFAGANIRPDGNLTSMVPDIVLLRDALNLDGIRVPKGPK
jgi:hypothetical protein